MKEPVKIDAATIKSQIAACEKWLTENKGKNPPQERDTTVAVELWKKIIADSEPI